MERKRVYTQKNVSTISIRVIEIVLVGILTVVIDHIDML